MSDQQKISPAFEPLLREAGSGDKLDAVVILNPPPQHVAPPRARLRALAQRLKEIEARAAAQKPIHARLADGYRIDSAKRIRKGLNLRAVPIGDAKLPVMKVEVTAKTLPALAERPDVAAILPNQRVNLVRPKQIDYKDLGKQESKAGFTWGLTELEVPDLWSAAKTKGAGVRAAVLDTGVHDEHPALAGRIKGFVAIDPLGRRIQASPGFDAGNHGTHVCGTIAGGTAPFGTKGVAIGVAPEADLLVSAVLIGDATLVSVVEAITWAVESGADVINMSLGFTYYEPLFGTLMEMLVQQYGVLPVVAIGNENHGNTSSPGNAEASFSVGAIEKAGKNKVDVAFFSSGASLEFPAANARTIITKPDVVAPGVQVFSSIPPTKEADGEYEYTYMDGTSMATPHASGVASLLMAAKPSAPLTEIVNALKETAKHPTGARPDNRWGFGVLRPLEAWKVL